MIWGFAYSQIVASLSAHFLLSASVGLLAYSLTWTITRGRERGTRLLLSSGLALAAHVLEDWYIGIF